VVEADLGGDRPLVVELPKGDPELGDVITLRATVNAAWRTSMEVGVRVEAEHVPTGEVPHTCTAYLTMVSLEEDEKPVPRRRLPRTSGATATPTTAASSGSPRHANPARKLLVPTCQEHCPSSEAPARSLSDQGGVAGRPVAFRAGQRL
jgi:acyl-CoA hydrolase